MMTNTFSRLPLAAGSAILSGAVRSAVWLMKKYFSAPATSTGVAVLTIGLAAAASNALYGQHGVHPAPLFFGPQANAEAMLTPVAPVDIAPRPARETAVTPLTTAPVVAVEPDPVPATAPAASVGEEVTNADLAAAQQKLQSMGLFDGEVDGFYGPQTAEAIRAFELRNGLAPKGDMSRSVIDAIIRAEATDNASIENARTTARVATPETMVAASTATPAVAPVATPPQDQGSGQQAVQSLIAPATPTAPTVTTPEVETQAAMEPVTSQLNPLADAELIEKIQGGLASLGFLHGRIDGVAGEGTARAIRNFEVFNNYEVTGRVSPELVELLVAAGADI